VSRTSIFAAGGSTARSAGCAGAANSRSGQSRRRASRTRRSCAG